MLRERIVAYYVKHNPEKLKRKNFPDMLIAAYRREKRLHDLLPELCEKYGQREEEWVLLQGLPKRNRRSTAANKAVHDHCDGVANVEGSGTPDAQPSLLSTPAVVVEAGCCDKQTQCTLCSFAQ